MSAWAVAACAAGGVGALARYLCDGYVTARVRTPRSGSTVPVATVGINVAGSALIGVLTGLVMFAGAPDALTLVLGTGFCGGFTTFSTASFDTVALARRESPGLALAHAIGTWVAAVGACGLGVWLAWLAAGN